MCTQKQAKVLFYWMLRIFLYQSFLDLPRSNRPTSCTSGSSPFVPLVLDLSHSSISKHSLWCLCCRGVSAIGDILTISELSSVPNIRRAFEGKEGTGGISGINVTALAPRKTYWMTSWFSIVLRQLACWWCFHMFSPFSPKPKDIQDVTWQKQI